VTPKEIVEALKTTYTAQLNFTYEKTTTDQALIDASFHFDGSNDQNAGVAEALRQLLAGSLDDFLSSPRPGVTLVNGALTHEVKRQSHVDLTLPFLKLEGDWISTATTGYNAIDQNNGRLTMYQLDQVGQEIKKNTFTSLWQGRNWRSTTLSVAGQISRLLPMDTGIRVYRDTASDEERSAATTASIRLEVQGLSLSQLEAKIEPFARVFMRQVFPDHASFEKWAETGRLLTNPSNSLVSMDVSIPSQVPIAWLKNRASGKNDLVYRALSLQLQFLLRAYLPRYYFQDINQFKNLDPGYLVLLYAALPRCNSIVPPDDIYPETQSKDQVMSLCNSALASVTSHKFA
jgi:hypothetical protein